MYQLCYSYQNLHLKSCFMVQKQKEMNFPEYKFNKNTKSNNPIESLKENSAIAFRI